MISDEQLVSYASGLLTGDERARFEAQLAQDSDALQRLVEQERMDAALCFVVGDHERETLRQSILDVAAWPTHGQFAEGVMAEVAPEASVEESAAAARVPWWDWVRAHWRLLAYAGAAMVALLLILIALPGPKPKPVLAQPRPVPGSNTVTPVPREPLATWPTSRTPATWPFAADSPWNTPLGSGAQFAAIQPGGMDLGTGIMVVSSRISHPIFRETPGEEPVELVEVGKATPLAMLRLPDAALAATATSRNLHLIAADGHTLYEVFGAQRPAGRALLANRISRFDLRGSGIPPEFASANGSGLTPFAGSLARGEWNGPIRRAIGSVVPFEAVSVKSDGTAHVWPAGWSSANNPAMRAKMAARGNVHLGSLLAIPPGVNLASLGVGTSGPAYEIARALQSYGLYVKDAFDGEWFTEWHRAGGPHLIICADFDSPADLPPKFREQLALVIRHLQVVVNNGPQSVGGGGTRRQPGAPDFGKQ